MLVYLKSISTLLCLIFRPDKIVIKTCIKDTVVGILGIEVLSKSYPVIDNTHHLTQLRFMEVGNRYGELCIINIGPQVVNVIVEVVTIFKH